MNFLDVKSRQIAIENSRNQSLGRIEAYKKEELERIAVKYKTYDKVGDVFTKAAIAVLVSFYGVFILYDLIKLGKYLYPNYPTGGR